MLELGPASHPAPPPQQPPNRPQLLELASLLHAYGLVSAVPAYPAHGGPPSPQRQLSPDSRARRARQKAAPKLNSDGSVRLNARQRRTLRRAQERAMKALLEAQTKAHGISSEQVRVGQVGLCGEGRPAATRRPLLLHTPPPPLPRSPQPSVFCPLPRRPPRTLLAWA